MNFCYNKAEKRFGRTLYGILGVMPSPKEIIGVFPELSATIIPHSQEIRFHRGDSFNIDVQIQNDEDPPSSIDIARAVLRFSARQGYGNTPSPSTRVRNEGAIILKYSYDSNEISFVNETNGQARIHIKKADTIEHPNVPAIWDIELTRPVEHIEGTTGTVKVQYGDPIVAGLGTNFPESIGLGDILHIQDKHVLILQRIDERTLKVDFSNWTSEQGLSYNLYTGNSKTIAGGPWNCLGDAVI